MRATPPPTPCRARTPRSPAPPAHCPSGRALWAIHPRGSARACGRWAEPFLRSLFERGLEYVGNDFLSGPLWRRYAAFERSQKRAESAVVNLYTRILNTPLKDLDQQIEECAAPPSPAPLSLRPHPQPSRGPASSPHSVRAGQTSLALRASVTCHIPHPSLLRALHHPSPPAHEMADPLSPPPPSSRKWAQSTRGRRSPRRA